MPGSPAESTPARVRAHQHLNWLLAQREMALPIRTQTLAAYVTFCHLVMQLSVQIVKTPKESVHAYTRANLRRIGS